MKNDLTKFLTKIDRVPSGCWEWRGHVGSHGYGNFWYEGKLWRAHRFAYNFLEDTLPDDPKIYLCHLCNNTLCVNPEHLRLGDAKINYNHAIECGRVHHKDQRYGRKSTTGRELPKGILWEPSRKRWKVHIRVGNKRYQARKRTLEEAILWRSQMEDLHWTADKETQS